MAPHSSTLAWKVPWTEEPGRLQSMGLLRVGYDWATSLSLLTFLHWRRKWQPTPVFLPGECRDGGVWWAAVYGVAQSWTRLKWLSSSSIICVRNVIRNCQTVYSGCVRVTTNPYFYEHFLCCQSLILAFWLGMEWYLIVVFNLHFLIVNVIK